MALIIHGKQSVDNYFNPEIPSPSNEHWLPWLQKQLNMLGWWAQTPEMFAAHAPEYEMWCRSFDCYKLSPEITLVGHSCGAGFLVRWLSEHPDVRVGKVVLVAPSTGPMENGFYDFAIDHGLVARTASLTIFASDNDYEAVQASVIRLRRDLPGVIYREFHNYGHFRLTEMGTRGFPELLAELVA